LLSAFYKKHSNLNFSIWEYPAKLGRCGGKKWSKFAENSIQKRSRVLFLFYLFCWHGGCFTLVMKKLIFAMAVLGMVMSDAALVLALPVMTDAMETAAYARKKSATCSTIEEQITAAQAIEAYTAEQVSLYIGTTACTTAYAAYSSAVQAFNDLEDLKEKLLCEGSGESLSHTTSELCGGL
jgi:hypothetical protein